MEKILDHRLPSVTVSVNLVHTGIVSYKQCTYECTPFSIKDCFLSSSVVDRDISVRIRMRIRNTGKKSLKVKKTVEIKVFLLEGSGSGAGSVLVTN